MAAAYCYAPKPEEGRTMSSHTVLVEFNCKRGLGRSVIEGLLQALPETRAYEGAERIEAYVDQDNPDRIVVWEKWTDRVHQETYLNWRIETGVLASFLEALTEPPRFVHLGHEVT